MPDNNEKPKFNLEEDAKLPLRLFFFAVQRGPTFFNVLMEFRVSIAYTEDRAKQAISETYPKGQMISITSRGGLNVKDLLGVLNFGDNLPQALKVENEPKQDVQPTEQQFVFNMLLIADRFIEDTEDKETIKKILGKIKKQ